MKASTQGCVRAGQSLFWALFILCLAQTSPAKNKDDVIVMKNGDRLTGEIKQLDHGLLYLKASYMNASVELDWNEVATLQTKDPFITTLTSGRRVTGAIERTREKQSGQEEFVLGSGSASMVVQPTQVIEMRQAEESIWKQVKGDADFGLSYTSGTNPTTLSLSANVAYQGDKNLVSVSTSSQFSSQSNAPNSFRYTLDSDYSRFFARRWFAIGLFDFLKSDQQDLNWRTTYGAGFGKEIVRTDRSAFQVFGGLDYSREQYFPTAGRDNSVNSMEGLVGAKYTTFRFKTLDVSWDGIMFPSITDSPRVRFTTSGNLRIELIKDLYWSFRVYENYDTKPPVNAPKSDFGLSTSLGFKF
jgi:putative salt-induced outer membrane protein YdiY